MGKKCGISLIKFIESDEMDVILVLITFGEKKLQPSEDFADIQLKVVFVILNHDVKITFEQNILEPLTW